MSNCVNCGGSVNGCYREICLSHYYPINDGCGADHVVVQFAPDQCISGGDFLKCGPGDLAVKWEPGDSDPIIGVAFEAYSVAPNGEVDCGSFYGNMYICGYFEVPPHLVTTLKAISCMSNSGLKKISSTKYKLT